MQQPKGFILPLMLILLCILSILMSGFFETERLHLSFFQIVKKINETNITLLTTVKKEELLKKVEQANLHFLNMPPDPPDLTTALPADGSLYLRAVDTNADLRIWQIYQSDYLFTIRCNSIHNRCVILSLRRLI